MPAPSDRVDATSSPPSFELRTMGHACLLLLEDGVPLVATDPWLIGSAYFRSWWLDEYPTDDDLALVAAASWVYVTHSHPDHFHPPTLRRLGRPRTLHPDLPGYVVPGYLERVGIEARVMAPARWYRLSDHVRMVSVPIAPDDSALILDTPVATVVNLNDCAPPAGLLATIRRHYLTPGRPVVVLRSHSPASSGSSMHRGGVRKPLHDAADYVRRAGNAAAALDAACFVPFASQVHFGRTDSRWANEFKVTTDHFAGLWAHPEIEVCPPHVTLDLATLAHDSGYQPPEFELSPEHRAQAAAREAEEAAFLLPADFADRLERYLREVWFLRLLYRHGVGWRLRTSGRELFYDVRRRRVREGIPANADVVITAPDAVVAELVAHGDLTDLGITMTIRTDTRVDVRRAYSFFSLLGLHDAGHMASVGTFARFARFNARLLVPQLFARWWRRQAEAPTLSLAETKRAGRA